MQALCVSTVGIALFLLIFYSTEARRRVNISVVLLASLYILDIKVSLQKQQFLYRGSEFREGSFIQHPRVFLDVSPVAIERVLDAMSCVLECLRNERCLSLNFKVKSSAGNTHDCQLLDTDKYNGSDSLKSHKDFNHHSLHTPCESSPCQNGGTCRPIYEKEDYECDCVSAYRGANCEKEAEVKLILPDSEILKGHPDYDKKLSEYMGPVQVSGKKWTLCFRASEHQFKAAAFHAACDNKGPTVTVIRVGVNVFGGYADKSWDQGHADYITSTAAFLFSLKNHLNEQHKMAVYQNEGRALDSRSYLGPSFGLDLTVVDAQCYSSYLGDTYKSPNGYAYQSDEAEKLLAGSHEFKCNEYEVFYET